MFARVGFEGSFYTAGIAYIGSLYVTKSMRYFGPLVAMLGILSVGDFNVRVLKYILMITIIMLIRKFIEESQKSFNIRNQMVSVFVSTLLVNLVCTVILGRTLCNRNRCSRSYSSSSSYLHILLWYRSTKRTKGYAFDK